MWTLAQWLASIEKYGTRIKKLKKKFEFSLT